MNPHLLILTAHILGSIFLVGYMLYSLKTIFNKNSYLLINNFKTINIITVYVVVSGLLVWFTNKSNEVVFCQKIYLYTLFVIIFQSVLITKSKQGNTLLKNLGIISFFSIIVGIIPLLLVNYS